MSPHTSSQSNGCAKDGRTGAWGAGRQSRSLPGRSLITSHYARTATGPGNFRSGSSAPADRLHDTHVVRELAAVGKVSDPRTPTGATSREHDRVHRMTGRSRWPEPATAHSRPATLRHKNRNARAHAHVGVAIAAHTFR